MRNCATLLTILTYYFVSLVIVLEMADVETPKAYCGLAGLGLTQAVPLQELRDVGNFVNLTWNGGCCHYSTIWPINSTRIFVQLSDFIDRILFSAIR